MTRDEQKEYRRRQILQKALELFATKGYSETKIGDIAQAANMSTGLMFHYFQSKEQLYGELVRMGVEGTNFPRELPFENPLEYFTLFLEALLRYALQEPWVLYMFVLMAQARRSERIPAEIRELAMGVNQIEQSAGIIAAGQQQGYFRQGDPYALAFTFWSSVQGVMEQLAATPEEMRSSVMPKAQWLIQILRGET